MKNFIYILLLCIGLLVFAGMVGGLFARYSISSGDIKHGDIEYKDLVSLLLTAISLLLALVTVVISFFAVLGWNAISEKAKKSADKFLKNGFKEGNELHITLQKKVLEATIAHLSGDFSPEDPLVRAIAEVATKEMHRGIDSVDEES